MVIDPCFVVVENAEAFTATAATSAIAVASIYVSVVLRNVNEVAIAEVAHTALRCLVTGIYAILAMSTRAVAKCQSEIWQWSTSDANVAATAVFTIDTRRKEASENKFIEHSRCR